MLKAADLNRRRIRRRGSADLARPLGLATLRRAMATEFALGVAVLATTAVMVVTTP
jgi:putative copper export protein